MQRFQEMHSRHEKDTRIVSDYVTEQPDDYLDVTDDYEALAPTNPQTQQDLIDLVNDPKTIKKAVEGSMEKRQALIDRDPQTEEKK